MTTSVKLGNYANVVIAGSSSSGTFTLAPQGAVNTTWASSSMQYNNNAVVVKGDAEFHGKVKINGDDLAATLSTIQKRLNILVPDPKLLHKYQALQQAYDHYKTLEALCFDDTDPTQ